MLNIKEILTLTGAVVIGTVAGVIYSKFYGCKKYCDDIEAFKEAIVKGYSDIVDENECMKAFEKAVNYHTTVTRVILENFENEFHNELLNYNETQMIKHFNVN